MSAAGKGAGPGFLERYVERQRDARSAALSAAFSPHGFWLVEPERAAVLRHEFEDVTPERLREVIVHARGRWEPFEVEVFDYLCQRDARNVVGVVLAVTSHPSIAGDARIWRATPLWKELLLAPLYLVAAALLPAALVGYLVGAVLGFVIRVARRRSRPRPAPKTTRRRVRKRFGLPEFHKRFTVSSRSPELAERALTLPLQRFLVEQGPHVLPYLLSVEIRSGVLTCRFALPEVRPENVANLLWVFRGVLEAVHASAPRGGVFR